MNECAVADRLLERAGMAMSFEKITARDAPYLDGLGFVCPYKVTFERGEKHVEVIALINNEHVSPTANQVLATLSTTVEDLGGAESFEQWCTVPDLAPYDTRKVQEGDQDYLAKRYHYLSTTKQKFQSIVPDEHFALFAEFFFRYVINDWPW